jgi:uncharacterized protein
VTERENAGSGGDLDRALADLRALSGDMASCAVLSADGVLISSSHTEGVDRERAAAMLAAVANLAERAARQEGKEHASQVRVDAEDGHLLLVRLDGGAGHGAYLRGGTSTRDVAQITFDDGSQSSFASNTPEGEEFADIARKLVEMGV